MTCARGVAQQSFSLEDAQFLQEHGLNAIRLGAMWPGVEPVQVCMRTHGPRSLTGSCTQGEYSASYLSQVRTPHSTRSLPF